MDNLVLSGKPAIIIRCGSNFTRGNIQFIKGQVVACITDSDVDFYYTKVERKPTAGAMNLGYAEAVELSSLTIHSVPFNKMLSAIVFGSQPTNETRTRVEIRTSDEDGIIPLMGGDISNIQVYDMQWAPIEFTTISSDTIQVAANIQCRICYEYTMNYSISLDTVKPVIPYFELECISTGNSIEESGRTGITQIIKVKRAALQLDPFFRFNSGIDNFDLSFVIIRDRDNKIIYGR